jgi:sec-independent protein translocase protein TatC
LARPLPVKELIFLNPTDAFMVRLKAAIVAGILIGLPFLFYQMWAFVAPGLYRREKRYVFSFVILATLSFFCGASFGFFVMLPFGIKFLLGYQTDILKPTLAVGQYFGFIFKMLLAFGLVFELPLVSFFLAKMGVITSAFLRDKRRYSYVIIFMVAAVLTPPDIFSQILMAIPLIFLYELSIIVCRFAK